MNGSGTSQRHIIEDLSRLSATIGDTYRALDEAERDPDLARVLRYIEDELDDRLRTDAQDKPSVSAGALVAGRYRLLARMACRYRSAAASSNRRRRSNASLMLAAMHRLASSGRRRTV
jgi:hypothetical protein